MAESIKFGNAVLPSNVLLAPMAGVTDLPFRRIVREFGPFLVFSEMIASNAVIRHVARTRKMMEGTDDDQYTSVQIVGADPRVMAEAAVLSESLGARFIDINMGCPVRKIVRSSAGSALMRDESLAGRIISSVVRAVNIPVSLKMRLGWDHGNKNAVAIAGIAESCGVSMVSVHARTRSQLYSGLPDWKFIINVKEAVKIPVIVNGSITDIESAKRSLIESSADGVMIGRGSLGAPWILRDIHNAINNLPAENNNFSKYDIMKKHISYILDFYEKTRAILICRKVLMYYCKGVPNAAIFRNRINAMLSETELFRLVEEICTSQEIYTSI
jgi:tRNA-dihydrouridine synthase B